jgi:hypothetical protein
LVDLFLHNSRVALKALMLINISIFIFSLAANCGECNRVFVKLRGGNIDYFNSIISNNSTSSTINVVVSTSVGSNFLDKKKKLALNANSTIIDLKNQINNKFPGSPPQDLQRIFFGSQQVLNNQSLINITKLNPIPLLLDMITGTSVYNKALSVTQAIEAYSATIVQQAYLSEKLKLLLNKKSLSSNTENTTDIDNTIESQYYREMLHSINESIYEKYAHDIAQSLTEEMNPVTVTLDTKAWRSENKKEVNPLNAALAKEFDLNIRGLRSFIYYSLVLTVFSFYFILCYKNYK